MNAILTQMVAEQRNAELQAEAANYRRHRLARQTKAPKAQGRIRLFLKDVVTASL